MEDGQREDGAKPGKRRLTVGWIVFLALAGLTGVEYIGAVGIHKNVPVLAIFALVKAALIVWYFMHLASAWRAPHD